MNSPADDFQVACERIADEKAARTGSLDLTGLFLEKAPEELSALIWLREIKFGDIDFLFGQRQSTAYFDIDIISDLIELEFISIIGIKITNLGFIRNISSLKALIIVFTPLIDLSPLSGLSALEHLDCSETQVADLSPLSGLSALRQLTCAGTQVSNLSPLSSLSALEQLDCSRTQVMDLSPLSDLPVLQRLDCWNTQVSDLSPLSGLSALQQLSCPRTQVTDLSPLSGLSALQYLSCAGTQVTDLSPLSGLSALRQLDCSNTQVVGLSPLAGMPDLRQLDCSSTPVTDLSPLSGLSALQQLDCSRTQVSDLSPLSGLSALHQFDCGRTKVSALLPVAHLPSMRYLNCVYCHICDFEHAALMLAEDCELISLGCSSSSVPMELLSKSYGDNCLERVRAHSIDREAASVAVADIRVLIVGNGHVGKTQITRWLAAKPYQPNWDSTHGIQIEIAAAPGDAETKLHIWDFGGQDIYHSTHTLFLRSPAILMPVWAQDEEALASYEHGGLQFRNHPLAYWIDILRQQGHPDSPVLVVQNKCDQPGQDRQEMPVSAEALAAFRFSDTVRVSAKERRGQATLHEKIGETIAWLRDPQRYGSIRIGAGRLRVQRRLEALREADQDRAMADRRHRFIERSAFDAICAEEGGVSSPEMLLHYLDANGTVFHKPGLFRNRIILDQSWALDAIYAVFARGSGVYRTLRGYGGRFTREALGQLAWRQHSEAEQHLLLDMMRTCGICFPYRYLPGSYGPDTIEYIAPDLLPERENLADEIAQRWDDTAPSEERCFDYAVLHGGLIRAVMAAFGEEAGLALLYWRGGLCGFEKTTRCRFIIEERMTGSWQGSLRVAVQGPQARELLDRLIQRVEKIQDRFGMRPITVPQPAPATAVKDETPMVFEQEKPAEPEWYVSYAWGDDSSDEARRREEKVDALCAEAKTRGINILRDKDAIALGDSISKFMKRIGKGDRIFVFLSDKYLRSPNCMFELCEILNKSRHEEREFLDRVRVYTLDDADVWRPLTRAKYAAYWRKEYDELDDYLRDNGGPTILGARDFEEFRRMREFQSHVGDILAMLADIRQPRNLDDLYRYGFD